MATDERLKQLLTLASELNEVIALRENLRSTQERCSELIQETRAKDRRIKELEAELEFVRRSLGQQAKGTGELLVEVRRVDEDIEQIFEEKTTPAGLPELDRPYDPFDMDQVMDGTARLFDKWQLGSVSLVDEVEPPLSLTTGSFLSPHKQPPFMPRVAPSISNYDRRMLIDGAGRAVRGRGRID